MTNANYPVIIDGILKEVGERLFWDPVRPIKAKQTSTGLARKVKARSSNQSAHDRIVTAFKNTVRRIPEVMVKISGGGKSFQHVKAHLDYISRNGQVTIEDEFGDVFSGIADLKDLETEWRYGGYPISGSLGTKQAFNIVLSMPPGTDRQAVKDAARAFAKAEFSENFSYVFAAHDDEKHPHVHLCVKAMGHDGTRLNPRKADLQEWRELFAGKLRDHGIEANATKRQVRGITRRPKKQTVIHLEKRGLRSLHREELTKAAEVFIQNGSSIVNPLKPKILRTRQFVIASWNAIGHALQDQGAKKLSAEINTFVEALPPPEGVGELFEKQLRRQVDKVKHRDKGEER